MRVRLTHYTVQGDLKSWVVQGSLDGWAWTELDRKTNNYDLTDLPWTASCAVSNSAECRFIRLLQTGLTHERNDILSVYFLEFFGTLFE
jgi:hypothetical protein